MGIFIIILITLIVGIYIGYRLGVYFIRKENRILLRQIQLLEYFSTHWAGEAADKQELAHKIGEQQNHNVNTTMATIINVIRSFQSQQINTVNQEEQSKFQKIINQVKDNFSL